MKLGNEVRDVITGFTGIAIQRSEMLSGTVQIAVQPRSKEGETDKMPDAINIDVQLLEFVSDGIADRATQPDNVTLALGVEVKDLITGMTGITIEKTVYINGCVRYGVQPPMQPGKTLLGEPPPTYYVDYKRLQPLSDAMTATIRENARKLAATLASAVGRRAPNPADAAPQPRPSTGGPNRRVSCRY